MSVGRARAVVSRLACARTGVAELEVLDGGLTNRNYRVRTADGRSVVARFSDTKSSLLAIDRYAEAANSRIAAQAGVGPAVVEFVPDDGVLVVEWITGRTFSEADLHDGTNLSRLAALCRRLHAAPPFTGDFDMFAIQRRYLDIVRSSGFRLPAGYDDHAPALRRIEAALRASAPPTVPCHNDLLAANMIDDGQRLWLIDFEYAGNNDPHFELGNIASEADLDVDRLEHLVTAYTGRRDPVATARTRLYGLAAKYGWTLWASIQDAVGVVDFDFWSWGMAKYDRAEAEFADPATDRLISTVLASTATEGAEPWPTRSH